jgi:hypothetical protein
MSPTTLVAERPWQARIDPEQVLTIRPYPFARNTGQAARSTATEFRTFTSISRVEFLGSGRQVKPVAVRTDRCKVPRVQQSCNTTAVSSRQNQPCQRSEAPDSTPSRRIQRSKHRVANLHTAVPNQRSQRQQGRLAQRESASFTRKRSLVRSQYRPPQPTTCGASDPQVSSICRSGSEH